MKGAYRVVVETRKIKYDFCIKRNITIFTGDSGSGKTVLIDLIREYRRYGSDSGVSISCACSLRTLDNEDWEYQMKGISQSIIFIDEGNRFLVSKKFSDLVIKSDNYFVFATREKLQMLPYSIHEIYGFRKSGRFRNAKQTYNEIYHLYGEISETEGIEPAFVITEDSNSGYEFFLKLANQKNITCISAKGKSNVIKSLIENRYTEGKKLLIADGAAFGSEIKDVSEYISVDSDTILYAPESFEWLLLSANACPNVNSSQIIRCPENVIDSKEYASWEQYFTKFLTEQTKEDPVWRYSKKKLSKAYLSEKVLGAVKRFMKLIIWD